MHLVLTLQAFAGTFPGPQVTEPAIRRELLPNGLRLVTERVPHVRSVSLGVWLTRGSRHEPPERPGIAHFVEHMLFKGTESRSAEQIAHETDALGGQLDAFTSKEYAGYYLKVLDEHLPAAVEILADLVTRPAFAPEEIARERKVVLEEIKMIEDTPDDLVHELFAARFWSGHALGRPILGTAESVAGLDRAALRAYFDETYVAANFVVAAAGRVDHDRLRDLVAQAFAGVRASGPPVRAEPPAPAPDLLVRHKDLEQSHVCLGAPALAHADARRDAALVLNTVLGGSMSSRLFQRVREQRGLAYAVYSGLSAYRDAGAITIYAGCANEAVGELVPLVVDELRRLRREPIGEAELRRAKDHLKGSLVLGLESTSSRMTHLARQEIYEDRTDSLDELLAGVDRVTAEEVQALAATLFASGRLGLTVLGGVNGLRLPHDVLALD